LNRNVTLVLLVSSDAYTLLLSNPFNLEFNRFDYPTAEFSFH